MLRRIYSALLYIAAPLALAFTALRGWRDPLYRDRLAERLGYTKLLFDAPPIWIHAVSVGEVQAAAVLIRALSKRYPHCPILVTTATPTGAARVRALFGELVRHAYLPYDLPGAVARFLSRVGPAVAIVMEREIWPNLFGECTRRGIPILLASARLSQRSAERHRRLGALFTPALSENVTIAAQTPADARRFSQIGAIDARVRVVGNIKFDFDPPEQARAAGAAFRASQLVERAVWIAGSTHEGEEQIVVDAHRRVREQHPNALLVLVPRHPNRFDAVRSWLRSQSIPFASRSVRDPIDRQTSVLLVDTLGELLMLYAAGDVAFVGGSLVPIGGHNLLEPAALDKPIIVGPHNFNAEDVARSFLDAGAAIEVSDADTLASAVLELLEDSDKRAEMTRRARAILEENRGALDRLLELLEPMLSRRDPPAR